MEVNPIKSQKDVKTIKNLLVDNPRNLFLFTLGINCGIRVGDLCQLVVNQFLDKKVGDTIDIVEGKTGKSNFITINKSIYKTFKNYYNSTNNLKNDDYLFKSRKGNKHLHPNSVCRLIKQWCKNINLDGNYGNHTMRKTFGFHHRVYHNVGIEVLMKRYNHSSPSITQRYIGVDKNEIIDVCMNNI